VPVQAPRAARLVPLGFQTKQAIDLMNSFPLRALCFILDRNLAGAGEGREKKKEKKRDRFAIRAEPTRAARRGVNNRAASPSSPNLRANARRAN